MSKIERAEALDNGRPTGIVYRTIKCPDVSDIPRTTLWLWLTIVLGMWAVAPRSPGCWWTSSVAPGKLLLIVASIHQFHQDLFRRWESDPKLYRFILGWVRGYRFRSPEEEAEARKVAQNITFEGYAAKTPAP